eukprot:scaffold308067_cov15-Tisochrysis_lutea.AAC.1
MRKRSVLAEDGVSVETKSGTVCFGCCNKPLPSAGEVSCSRGWCVVHGTKCVALYAVAAAAKRAAAQCGRG